MQTKQIIVIVGIVCIVIVGMIVAKAFESESPYHNDMLGEFASCISESGATFFGAYWCGHCQAQKRDFGSASDIVPYVECALPGNEGQAEECSLAGITAYPTWVFGNGTKLQGRQTFETLANMTGCPLPVTNHTEV